MSIQEAGGLRWEVRESTDDLIGPAEHEAPLESAMAALLPPDGVFLDVGAHVGHYALRFARRCRRVIAIEPNPLAASGLRRNVALNGIQNVDVVQEAVFDDVVRLRLWDPYGRPAGGATRTLRPAEPASPPHNVAADDPALVRGSKGLDAGDVAARPLDGIDVGDRLDLVKIDVEGAEAAVLRGARRTFARTQPALWIELHDHMYGQHIRDETVAELDAQGYLWTVTGQWMGSTYLCALPRDRAVRPPAGALLPPAPYVLTTHDRHALCRATLEDWAETDWPGQPTLVTDEGTAQRREERQEKAARTLLRRAVADGCAWVLFLEDDLTFNRHLGQNLRAWAPLRQASPERPFLASLYNPNIREEHRCVDENYFVADPDAVYGSQALLMSGALAAYAVAHWDDVEGMQDIKISRLAARLTPIYYHRPSLVQHVGRTSSWGGPYHWAADFSQEWQASDGPT